LSSGTLRENQNYIYALPPLEILYQESFSILYFFFQPPTWLGHTDANWIGAVYYQVSIFAKLVCQTVGDQFFSFCQNLMDAKLICQTAGDVNSFPNHVVIFDF
jgi:hypothetical protein